MLDILIQNTMKPKQVKKEPSERTRNLRHGRVPERQTPLDTETDGRTRVNAEIASIALRTAAASGVHKQQKPLTSKQRRRRQEMMEKGSAFTEKIEKKAADTEKSQGNVKARAVEWDQVNAKAMAELYAADERVAKVAIQET